MPESGDRGRPVVVAGADGAIGSLVVGRLGARRQIRATDVRSSAEIESQDVTDMERCPAMFKGADAVVHLAGNPDQDAGWDALRGPNVEGAYAVAPAARECGVRRLVLASSLHAVSAYPQTRQRRAGDPPPRQPLRCDEGLGRGAWWLGRVDLAHVSGRVAHWLLLREPSGRR